MKKILVTGTDTNVGKTWVSCLILRHLLSKNLRTGAYKPVCSGAVQADNGDPRWTDVANLAAAIGRDESDELVCPQRFLAPLAPNVAAAEEGREVDDGRLSDGLQAWENHCDHLVIEGAGGLMCPLSEQSTVLDLAARLACPILIVADNRLGVISHTLLTVHTARSSGLSVAAVVLNHTSTSKDDASRSSNASQLRKWLPDVPLYTCRFNGSELTEPDNGSSLDPERLFRLS